MQEKHIFFSLILTKAETIGLTWSDVDMKNREIHVGGQLVYYEGDEGYCFHDSETKTDAGIRDIPMTQMVYDAFRKQRELNLMLGLQSNVEIGGRSGFIFNTKHGRPIMPAGVNSFLKNIVNAYNKKESKLAEEEKREPELMPPISSHTLRHTGCTRLGENNVNPKVMQYVMGGWMSGGHPAPTVAERRPFRCTDYNEYLQSYCREVSCGE